MPSYQPFIIGDYAFGEYAGKEPWLSPEAAFRTLTNGYVQNGRLWKRGGYSLLDDISPTGPIMGIFENRMLDGSSELIVFSDVRLFRLESGAFVDRAGSDTWAGGNSDYFSAAHAIDDALYIVNGVDVPYKWVGSTATLSTASTTGLSDALNWAKWVVWWKGRLWYFFTNEGAGTVRFPQRARFSTVNQPETFRDQDFIEATTSERMTGVQILGERIIVHFEESHWTIEETGDFRLPFVFRRIPSTHGAVGTMASFATNDILVTLSRHGLIGTNGERVERIDEELPRLMNRIDPSKFAYVYGGRDAALRQGWLLFAKLSDTLPNDALIYDWSNGAFAFYELPMHVIGSFRASSSQVWSSLDQPWDSYSETWDSYGSGEDAPVLLGGDRSGNVWILNNGVADGVTGASAGSSYTLTAKSQRLNPFKGQNARLGYLDVFCAPGPPAVANLRIKVFRDADNVPILVKDLNLEPASPSDEKVMRRISVNKTGQMFTIEIGHDAMETLAVDGFRLWMAPVGKGRTW